MSRALLLVALIGCGTSTSESPSAAGSGTLTVEQYCKQRQDLVEQVTKPAKHDWVVVRGCRDALHKAERAPELACRLACFETARGKPVDRAMLTELQSCDGDCFLRLSSTGLTGN